MKKLASKLSKIDIDLTKWTRDILFEHITEAHGMAIAGLILGIISFVCVAIFAALLLALILTLFGMGGFT